MIFFYQIIYLAIVIIGILVAPKIIGTFIHEDWFYSGKISTSVIEKRAFDVIMKFHFLSSHQFDDTTSKISSNELISKVTDIDLVCMVKQKAGKAKEGKLEFYFTKPIGCKEKSDDIKRSHLEKFYAKFRIMAFHLYNIKKPGSCLPNDASYGVKCRSCGAFLYNHLKSFMSLKPYTSYRWDSESLLPLSFYEHCLTFKGLNKNTISIPSMSITLSQNLLSFETIKFEIKINTTKLIQEKYISNIRIFCSKSNFALKSDEYPSTKIATSYLFSWDKIPGGESVKLIEFLKHNFDFDWLNMAKIEKIEDGKTIKVKFSEKLFLSLRLNNEKTEVNLKINDDRNDNRIYCFIAKVEDSELKIYFPSEYSSEFLFKIPNILDDGMFMEFDVEFTNEDYLLGDLVLKAITGIGPLPPREFSSNNECNYNIKINATGVLIKNLLKKELLYGVNDAEARNIAITMSKIFATNNDIDLKKAQMRIRDYFVSIQELCPLFLKGSIFKMIEGFKILDQGTDIIEKEMLTEQDMKLKDDLMKSFIIRDAFDKAYALLMEDNLLKRSFKKHDQI